MMHTKKEVIESIQKVVFEVTGNKVESDEISLLDTSLRITPADFCIFLIYWRKNSRFRL